MDRKYYFIFCGVLYFWFCVFIFPMIHDLIHELGHATVALTSCGSKTTSISLGEYEYCPHIVGVPINVCVFPKWFFQSLYRTSRASYWAPGNGLDPAICNAKLSSSMGGTFGLIFSWLLVFLIVTPVWKFYFEQPVERSVIAGMTYLFFPLRLWISVLKKQGLSWPFAFQALLGFGAIIMQLDLINDFFYTYFPSRLIIWIFMPYGDGSNFWSAFGVSDEDILKVSYAVWIALLFSYAAIFYSYYKFYKELKGGRVVSKEAVTVKA